jgi:hypothetical protein
MKNKLHRLVILLPAGLLFRVIGIAQEAPIRETTLDKIYKTSQVIATLLKINSDKKRNNKPNTVNSLPSNSTNFCIINSSSFTLAVIIVPKDTMERLNSAELVVAPGEKECFFNLKPAFYIFSIADSRTGQMISKGEMKLEEGSTFQKTIRSE